MKTLEILLSELPALKVIDSKIEYNLYFPLDLSVSNIELSQNLPENAFQFEEYISNLLKKNNAKVGFGGYLEQRNLYKRSSIFNKISTVERDMHIGLDLWTKAGTSVIVPLDGKVHSYKNNIGIGDYGPTIILEHQIESFTFYTLYGHLSLESIQHLKVGIEFKEGQILATLGDASVNGDYAPHLHFQIIKNIDDFWGDYPGVCSKSDLDFYSENCPNPNLLLKII